MGAGLDFGSDKREWGICALYNDFYGYSFQVVNMTRNGDIHFCKSFWHMAETDLMKVSL